MKTSEAALRLAVEGADGKLRLAQKLSPSCLALDPGAPMFARVITGSVGGLVVDAISES
jgi:hypothetical protein